VTGATLFEARGLGKRFHGLVALSDVGFAIERGSILGLIGPNGAGKTTLVSVIGGALRPDAGEIRFEGARIEHLAPYRRAHLGIGRTYQIAKPFPGLTVLQNVTLGALSVATAASMIASRRANARPNASISSVWRARAHSAPRPWVGPTANGSNSPRRWRWRRSCCCWTR